MRQQAIPQRVASFIAAAKDVLDISPDGVMVFLPGGEIAYANSSAAKILEADREGLLGRLAEEINEANWSEIVRIFQDGQPQLNVKTEVKGKAILVNRLPLKSNGQTEAVVSFFQSLLNFDPIASELASYKQMAKQLEAIMESSYDGLWITDNKGNVVKLNKAAERITGCRAEFVLGRNVAELVAAGYINESVTLEVLKRKTTVSLVQYTKLQKKVLATGSPIFNADGEIDVIIINDRDITELDRMTKELEESKALIEVYRRELSGLQLRDLTSDHFICRSKAVESVYKKALHVARFDSSVLLSGESGVGKGLLAKLIHQHSDRREGPFVRVDCAAIVETLFESELFGYEKGAFTGAGAKGKVGLIELADRGTLFLDEISEVPLNHQVKLLRFLDEKQLIRVGGSQTRQVDARIIAATNKDLAEEVRQGRFRRDLFYRLNVVHLHLPPLRGRTGDILDLINFFLEKMRRKHRVKKQLDPQVLDILLRYSYPGNVRELENIIESMAVMSVGETITPADLPPEVRRIVSQPFPGEKKEASSLITLVQRLEVERIQEALKVYGSQKEAARHLGVNQSTISRKLKKHRHLAAQS